MVNHQDRWDRVDHSHSVESSHVAPRVILLMYYISQYGNSQKGRREKSHLNIDELLFYLFLGGYFISGWWFQPL